MNVGYLLVKVAYLVGFNYFCLRLLNKCCLFNNLWFLNNLTFFQRFCSCSSYSLQLIQYALDNGFVRLVLDLLGLYFFIQGFLHLVQPIIYLLLAFFQCGNMCFYLLLVSVYPCKQLVYLFVPSLEKFGILLARGFWGSVRNFLQRLEYVDPIGLNQLYRCVNFLYEFLIILWVNVINNFLNCLLLF